MHYKKIPASDIKRGDYLVNMGIVHHLAKTENLLMIATRVKGYTLYEQNIFIVYIHDEVIIEIED